MSRLDRDTRALVDARSLSIEPFPGLLRMSRKKSRALSRIALQENKFTAVETSSLLCQALFIFIGVLSDDAMETWLAHVERTTGFHQKEFSLEQRQYRHQRILPLFMRLMQIDFQDVTGIDCPKMHDPDHDELIVDDWAAFPNLDELAMEACHQPAKAQGRLLNHVEPVEETLLKRESRRRQLNHHCPDRAQRYNDYVRCRAAADHTSGLVLSGRRVDEDWSEDLIAWKWDLILAALRTVCPEIGADDIALLSEVVRIYSAVRSSVSPVHIRAMAVFRGREAFHDALLSSQVSETLHVLPWGRLCQLFSVVLPNTKVSEWALIQVYEHVDSDEPIHPLTGAPYVKLVDEVSDALQSHYVIPAAGLIQRVHVVNDVRPEFVGNMWINWWVTIGPCPYPEQRRWQLQRLWRWRHDPDRPARSQVARGRRKTPSATSSRSRKHPKS
eukprot:TRINITY_DN1028_c0_g1_i6.p2 TRINITY_DN1028_c0_g1~~TRINITY_DN1028_c0_g1_i6.p2  ORF type:complete len:443 (-),score=29.00 TRINITY_DN1028_c0_g1_i6:290-1618(-)